MPSPRGAFRIIVTAAYMAVGALIAYALFTERVRGILAIVLPVLYVTAGYRLLLGFVGPRTPSDPSTSKRQVRELLLNLAKAGFCFGAGLAIAAFATPHVANTYLGVALVFGPGLAFGFGGAYFLWKAFSSARR
jgi:hypothetical protein